MDYILRRCALLRETKKAWIITLKCDKSKRVLCIPKSQSILEKKEPNRMTGFKRNTIHIKKWLWDKQYKNW